MKLGSLKNHEPSVEILTNTDQDTDVEGITDSFAFLERHLLFIKNKTFANEFLESEKAKDIGILIEKKYFDLITDEFKKALIDKAAWLGTVADVNLAMSFLSRPFYDEKIKNPNDMIDGRQMGSANVHPSAWIAQGAFIGENVKIGSNVKIHSGVVLMSGVQIGEDTEIFPNTTIYRNVQIGARVRIHALCSIGADGFGYNFSKGVHHKVWHMGSVIIGNDVEIGASSCIDSGTFSPTMIGSGTKIDNQVQIGHNCRLGTGVILCGQVGLGGSTSIGDYTVLGGKAAVANGIEIGKAVQIAGGAGVTNDIQDGAVVGGFPARDIKEWMKGVATLRKLSLSKNKTE
jgi:UDP-3-O-[3-hydroxymyristoyl] glucosamine N-acyltransferase